MRRRLFRYYLRHSPVTNRCMRTSSQTVALIFACMLPGCSAVQNVWNPHTPPGDGSVILPDRRVYGGVAIAARQYGPLIAKPSTPMEPVVGVAGLAIDGSCSAVVDTLTLPLTVPVAWKQGTIGSPGSVSAPADDRLVPKIALHDDAGATKAEIIKVIPPGTRVDEARRIMERNGFACEASKDDGGREYIWCVFSRSVSWLVSCRWAVRLYHRDDRIDEVAVSLAYTGP